MSLSLVDYVFGETIRYLENMPKAKRKEIGQFFTSSETARYMAQMFTSPKKEILNILDPGTGSGILTAAVIDRLQNETNLKHICITCYEISVDVLPILKHNLEYIRVHSAIPVDYKIIEQNYITSQKDDFNSTLFKTSNPQKYDLIISNPPYKKIRKDSEEAKAVPSLCYGSPNLYSLFASVSLFNLSKDGEMVFIIPRSWTSGAYFQKFREYLFNYGTLKHVHLFVSRDKVFEKESILQETIIIKVDKSEMRESVKITCSNSNSDFNNVRTINLPYSSVVVGSEKYLFLVTSKDELEVLRTLNQYKNTLPSIGLKMRTGLTVDFRSHEYLRDKSDIDTVPLFYSQHIKNGQVVFPIEKDGEYITIEKDGLIQKNKNYLFVKRFTAKEEKRRLQSGIYLSEYLPNYDKISTQNKINFIDGIGFDMTKEQVYGLYVIFNSTIYDQYYRILNGSTQVNSSEINSMPIPPLTDIEKLGSALMRIDDLSVSTCDKLLGDLIYEQN